MPALRPSPRSLVPLAFAAALACGDSSGSDASGSDEAETSTADTTTATGSGDEIGDTLGDSSSTDESTESTDASTDSTTTTDESTDSTTTTDESTDSGSTDESTSSDSTDTTTTTDGGSTDTTTDDGVMDTTETDTGMMGGPYYTDCASLQDDSCAMDAYDEFCYFDEEPFNNWRVCSTPCQGVGDCPPAGGYEVICETINLGDQPYCWISCSLDPCPDGMECESENFGDASICVFK